MEERREIQTKSDIQELVNSFYTAVLKDEILAPFFKTLDFDYHLPKMVHFWSFVLLDEPGYTTNVNQKHENMQLNKPLFDRWVALFSETIDRLFEGEKAEMAKQRATILAMTMASKLG